MKIPWQNPFFVFIYLFTVALLMLLMASGLRSGYMVFTTLLVSAGPFLLHCYYEYRNKKH